MDTVANSRAAKNLEDLRAEAKAIKESYKAKEWIAYHENQIEECKEAVKDCMDQNLFSMAKNYIARIEDHKEKIEEFRTLVIDTGNSVKPQDPEEFIHVIMNQYAVSFGKFVSETDDTVTIKEYMGGELTVPKSDIITKEEYSKIYRANTNYSVEHSHSGKTCREILNRK